MIVNLIDTANIGYKTGGSCTSIFLYADDIILLAPSAQALQSLVDICELELKRLDMAINTSKSACMRFGSRYKSTCANVSVSGVKNNWVSSHRYLGVYLVNILVNAVHSAIDRFSCCLEDVEAWMTASRLRLNASKTQVMWLGSRHNIDSHCQRSPSHDVNCSCCQLGTRPRRCH